MIEGDITKLNFSQASDIKRLLSLLCKVAYAWSYKMNTWARYI